MISSYNINGNKIEIQTPYCDDVVTTCRKWAGKFANGVWSVPVSRLDAVQQQLGKNLDDQVEIEVGKEDVETGAQYHIGWYVLCSRRGRDRPCDVYADLVAGELPERGGSMKSPMVSASDDVRFRLWVPRDFAQDRGLTVVTDPKVDQPETTIDPLELKKQVVDRIHQLMMEHGIELGELA